MIWTDERVDALKDLWRQGLSASQIATRWPDVSRNAVIGKIFRLGLAAGERRTNTKAAENNRRVVSRLRAKARKAAAPNTPRLQPEPLPPIHVDDIAAIKLIDLEPHHCRFPVGDPQQPGFGFCGGEKVEGLPYCAGHAQRAYVPAQPRRSGNPSPSYTQTVVRLHPPVSADERESVLEKV